MTKQGSPRKNLSKMEVTVFHNIILEVPRLWLFWALGPTPPAGTALEEVSPCQPPAWREQRGPPHWPITGTE